MLELQKYSFELSKFDLSQDFHILQYLKFYNSVDRIHKHLIV